MGIILSLLSAVLSSLRAACNKKSLDWFDEYYLAWATSTLGALVLITVQIFHEFPPLSDSFWRHLSIVGIINTLTSVLVLKALRLGDLSLVAPMKSFSPFFLLFTSAILLKEIPDTDSLIGILLIVFGSYMLEFRSTELGLLTPLKALWLEPSVRLMLLCALMWSVSSCYAKFAIIGSSPIFFTASLFTFMSLALTPVVLTRECMLPVNGKWLIIVVLTLLHVMEHLATWTAFGLTFAVYVLSIKRLGLMFSVVWGRLFFKEPRFFMRLSACVVMVAGVVLIAL